MLNLINNFKFFSNKINNFYKINNFSMFKKLANDNINVMAAAASFFIIISFLPVIILLLSLVKYSPVSQTALLDYLLGIVPIQVADIVNSLVSEIYKRGSGTLFSVNAIITLITASNAFFLIDNSLRQIYETTNDKNFIIKRFFSSLYTLAFIIILIIITVIMTFGESLTSFLSSHHAQLIAFLITFIFKDSFITSFLLFTLLIMFLYSTACPKRHNFLIYQLPGAVIVALGWMLFSRFYSFYTSYSQSFSYMYGSLNTAIFIMLWLYYCIYMLFLGAELNHFIIRLFKH